MTSFAHVPGGRPVVGRSRGFGGRISRLSADVFTTDCSTQAAAPQTAVRVVEKEAAGFGFIAECLAGDGQEPTVIVDGAGPCRFQRVFRRFRARLGAEPASRAVELLGCAARTGRPVGADVDVGGRWMSASCRPVLGPSGAVHAVRMRVGTPRSRVPVIPLEFDTEYLAHFGRPDLPVPDHFRLDRPWTMPTLLERVVWVDKRLEFIAMFDPFEPASRWCESLVVDDPVTARRRHLWMAARAATDELGARIVRAVIADLTDVAPAPVPDPMTEHLAHRTARGHGSALMDLRTTLMHSFSCLDPRMSPWRHRNAQVHSADVPAVVQAVADLASGRSARIGLRIRFFDDAPWIALDAVCTPLPNYLRPQANIDFWIEEQN